MQKLATIILSCVVLVGCQVQPSEKVSPQPIDDQREATFDGDMIVLTLIDDQYYSDVFSDILEFQFNYARLIRENGDHVRVLASADIAPLLKGKFEKEEIIIADMGDIWMRDFTTVNPGNPVHFRYTAAAQGGSQDESDYVSETFQAFASEKELMYKKSDLILDGGNVVDNYAGGYIITERFLDDNDLTKDEAKEELGKVLGSDQIAIIPSDDVDGLAHADGMVMFVEEDVIIINDYAYDPELKEKIMAELEDVFPESKIVEVPLEWDEAAYDERFSSACGINVNAVVTDQTIYMPHFGKDTDDEVIEIIARHTQKKIIPVPAENVCQMGGSVRCLSWQVAGENAEKLFQRSR